MARYQLPMFPLEHVVLPTASVSLTLFEPRYLALASYLAGTDQPEFGIVGIRRGREVGGGETRSHVGVVATVMDIAGHPDGRWSVVAVGSRRIVVNEWMPDDPYPVAFVEDWPDPLEQDLVGAVKDLGQSVDRLIDRLAPRQASPFSGSDSQSREPEMALWPMIRSVGFGPHDAMKLLEIPAASERARYAQRLIDERCQLLDALADEER